MTASEQFIQDALAGGWQQNVISPVDFQLLTVPMLSTKEKVTQSVGMWKITMDPTAWTAVQKTNNWSYARRDLFTGFIAQGKSVDEALSLVYSVTA